MDPRNYHEKFNQPILDCLGDLVKDFQFTIQFEGKYSCVELANEKCIVIVGYDSGFIYGNFIDPIEKKKRERIDKNGLPGGYPRYSIWSVWKFLYPNDKENFDFPDGTGIELQTLQLKKLIVSRLKNVLNGDFSWTTAFKENGSIISGKIEYMMTHWAMDNPVRLQFEQGDPGWQKSFDEYKQYLDNLQH